MIEGILNSLLEKDKKKHIETLENLLLVQKMIT